MFAELINVERPKHHSINSHMPRNNNNHCWLNGWHAHISARRRKKKYPNTAPPECGTSIKLIIIKLLYILSSDCGIHASSVCCETRFIIRMIWKCNMSINTSLNTHIMLQTDPIYQETGRLVGRLTDRMQHLCNLSTNVCLLPDTLGW